MPEMFTVSAKRLRPANKVDGLHITLPDVISDQCVITPTLLQISGKTLRTLQFFIATVVVLAALLLSPTHGIAAITPITWDTIGLDSNSPTSGPSVFPVGARITGPANTPGSATLHWEDPANPDPYIAIRNNQTLNFNFDSSGNADVYFEVQIPSAKRTTSAYGQTRSYYITSGAEQSVTRELYIERLISQGRNAITDIKVGTTKTNMVSVPNGGSMSLLKDNTYYIQLVGYTATSGYEQLEAFINFDNTVIQILSVETYGSATGTTIPYLYADACSWDANPGSIDYRSCLSTGKFGGNITVTYQIKILSVGSGSQQLNSLIHDFSGSSFHYNSDYSTTARTMNLIDPNNLNLSKSFSPNPTNLANGSTLALTVTNPNPAAISELSFADSFPTSPGNMRVGAPLAEVATTNGTATVTFPNENFKSYFAVNDTIILNGNIYTINSISGAGTRTLTVDRTIATATNVTVAGASITGTVTIASGSTTVTGTGTSFTTALSPGDLILISGVQYRIAAISSNTSMTLISAPSSTITSKQVKFLANSSCGGTLTESSGNQLVIGSSSIMLTGGTVPASGSCVVKTKVNVPATNTSYTNTTSGTLMAGGTTMSKTASATLTLSSTYTPPTPPPSSCANPIVLARWEMNTAIASGPPGAGPAFTSKAADVATAVANFVGVSGSSQSVATTDGHTYAWNGVTNSGTGWAEAAPTLSNYFEFILDTSNYGKVGINFESELWPNGDWANPQSPMIVTTNNGSTSSTETVNNSPITKGSWTTNHYATATNTGTSTTKFHIATSGASKSSAIFAIDNVTFTGCPRVKPPVMSKSFTPKSILNGGTANLTFLITNPNPNAGLTGLAFSDTMPVNNLTGTVTTNGTATVTGAGTKFSDELTVGSIINVGANTYTVQSITSQTSLTLTGNATSVSGATATAGLTLTGVNTSTCGGTLSGSAGAKTLSLSAGTLAADAYCTITAQVKASILGSLTNQSGAVSATESGNGNTASDSLSVTAPHPVITLFKEVATKASVPDVDDPLWRNETVAKKNDNIYYQLTVQNDGDVPLTNVNVTDTMYQTALNSCTWLNRNGVSVGSPNGSISLEVTTSSSTNDLAYCIITASPAANGTVSNTAQVSASYNGTALTFNSALMQDTAKYHGFIPPSVSKSFGTSTLGTGLATTLTLTLGNPSTNLGNLTGVYVNDTFPAGMTLKDTTFTFTPAACGTVTRTDGTTASVAGDNAVRFTAGSIAANTICQVQVNITSSTIGSVTNTTGTTSASGVVVAGKSALLAQTGATANASLTVITLPSLMILKSAVVSTGNPKARPGDTITYTVTVTETNGSSPDLNSVTLSDYLKDSISNYVDLRVDTYGASPFRPFNLTSGSSGLTLGLHEYSTDSGTSWVSNNPPNPSGGYDPTITNWRLTLNGTMTPSSSFTLTYSVRVK